MGQYSAKGIFTTRFMAAAALGVAMTTPLPALADTKAECRGLPSHADLKAALTTARNHASNNGGFDLDMWGEHRQPRRDRVRGCLHGK